MTVRVIDVSEFTREIPFSWWQKLREEHNVRGAVIQAWGGGPIAGRQNFYWAQQSEGARRAFGNGGIASYVWPPRDVGIALDYMKRESTALFDLQRFIALDVEAEAGVSSANVQTVRHAGQVPWVYVSPGGWSSIMAGSTSFSHVPLWLAGYPRRFNRMHWDVPSPAHPHALIPATIQVGEWHYFPLGGWKNAGGWQFDGTTPYRNETLDLNVFRDGVFGKGGETVAELDVLKNLMRVAGLFAEASAAALQGKPIDTDTKAMLKWLLR